MAEGLVPEAGGASGRQIGVVWCQFDDGTCTTIEREVAELAPFLASGREDGRIDLGGASEDNPLLLPKQVWWLSTFL